MRNEVLEAMGQDGAGLRVEFQWRGDRYGQVISLVEPGGPVELGGKVMPVLESVEGLPSEAWPASPPLQSLNFHDVPGGNRAALLVGMAGRSHWSASIEAVTGQAIIRFDIACRCGEFGVPGSTYRLLAGKRAGDYRRIEVARVAGRRVEIVAADELTGMPTSDEDQWIGVIAYSGPARPTERWRYEVAIITTSDC
jgi:hypothetical protein